MEKMSEQLIDIHTLDSQQLCFTEHLHRNQSHEVRCNSDGLIYRTDEVSIANEVFL